MRATVALLAVILLTGCTAGQLPWREAERAVPVAAPAPPRPLWADARGCTEAALVTPAEAGRVRDHVPAGWEIVGEESGRVLLTVSAMRCDALSLDGDDFGAATIAMVGAPLRPTRGVREGYVLWMTADVRELHGRLDALGIRSGHAERSMWSVSDAPTGPVVDVSLPSEDTPLDLTARAAMPLATGPDERVAWWHEGARGVVRLDSALTGVAQAPAEGTISAPEGSPLASQGVGAPGGIFTGSWRLGAAPTR